MEIFCRNKIILAILTFPLTEINSYLCNEFLYKLGFSNCPRDKIKTLATLVF
jgi:hypothetical protein